jgi:DnaJ-class molecular chaperone
MSNFNEIEEARKLLGLGEAATLKQIKTAYRSLAHRYHPDKQSNPAGEESAETMKRINRAYKLLTEYCDNYKYSFREEDIARTYPQEEYLRTFKDKWHDFI